VPELNKTSGGFSRGGGGGGGNRGPGRGPRRSRSTTPEGETAAGGAEGGKELSEKVVFINRSAKVVKGGRRFSFSALVVAGDKQGRVGIGLGKAVEVSEAIRKGGDMAKQQMVSISLKDTTIPHEIMCHYGGAKVMLRPASPGTGIIAGKTVRAVAESAGIKDLLSKSLGSNNPSNVVKATLAGLQQLRLREDIYRDRGLEIRKKPVAVPVAPAAPVPAAPPGKEAQVAAAPVPAAPTAAPVPIPNPQSAIRNAPAPVPVAPLGREGLISAAPAPIAPAAPPAIPNPQSAIRNPPAPVPVAPVVREGLISAAPAPLAAAPAPIAPAAAPVPIPNPQSAIRNPEPPPAPVVAPSPPPPVN
jgi:small subunit ribosomal protein S5